MNVEQDQKIIKEKELQEQLLNTSQIQKRKHDNYRLFHLNMLSPEAQKEEDEKRLIERKIYEEQIKRQKARLIQREKELTVKIKQELKEKKVEELQKQMDLIENEINKINKEINFVDSVSRQNERIKVREEVKKRVKEDPKEDPKEEKLITIVKEKEVIKEEEKKPVVENLIQRRLRQKLEKSEKKNI